MVRINLIHPKKLADQHLIAEYNELLMLFGHVDKHPEIRNQPTNYKLGRGHITFFKDKLLYLKKRHELLKTEMRRRKFAPTITIPISKYPSKLKKDYRPTKEAYKIIKERISAKIKEKPTYYRYAGKQKPVSFFLSLLK